MGQGGFVVVANGTESDWRLSGHHSYQMAGWNWPDLIPAWGKATVYVEWTESITAHVHDDGGEAEYTIQTTGEKLEFQARWPSGSDRRIQMYFKTTPVNGQTQGTTVSLGWSHDGFMSFVLTGKRGGYYATPVPQNWAWINEINTAWPMQPERTLRTMVVPASHDSGMSSYGSHTAFAFPCNTKTQTKSIHDQLVQGVRFFDVRPVISGGDYYTGHYSNLNHITDQGANGQSIDSVVNDVNTFMDATPDLVILRISSDLNTDAPNGEYKPFNQAQYLGLLDRLSKLRHPYVADPEVTDFTQVPISSFVGQNRGSVLVFCKPDTPGVMVPNNMAPMYYFDMFPLYDQYAGTNNLGQMQNDQIKKMGQVKTSADPRFFVLSWALTQDGDQATSCFIEPDGPDDKSIISLAGQANPTLYDKLWTTIQPPVYPNVVNEDNITDTTNLGLALAINYKLSKVKSPASTIVSWRAVANGKLVTADHEGGSPLIANRDQVGPWEQFLRLVNDDGSVSFRAHANGKVVTADNSGSAPLIANRDQVGPWEKFDEISHSDGTVSYRAHANGKYVCADNNGSEPLVANRGQVGAWESFHLIK
jgi:hypothetical protein